MKFSNSNEFLVSYVHILISDFYINEFFRTVRVQYSSVSMYYLVVVKIRVVHILKACSEFSQGITFISILTCSIFVTYFQQ